MIGTRKSNGILSGLKRWAHHTSPAGKVFDVLNLLFLALFALTALYPFIYTVRMSLSTQAEARLFDPGLAHQLKPLPRDVTWVSYQMVFRNPEILSALGNSLFRTLVGTAATLVVTCLCAYPLSRRDLPHRRSLMFVVLFTMLFSGGLIPTYLLYRSIGLIDSRWVYVLPMLTTAFYVIVVKSFFQAIPPSLAESAEMDGAGPWTILFRIYIPLSAPVLATVALWTAVAHWNMWFDALIYINSPDKNVLQGLLQKIVIENSTDLIERGLVNPDILKYTPETIKAASVIVTILPILLVYPFLQRYFVKGIMLGSVKE